jgi:hypothetical protein
MRGKLTSTHTHHLKLTLQQAIWPIPTTQCFSANNHVEKGFQALTTTPDKIQTKRKPKKPTRSITSRKPWVLFYSTTISQQPDRQCRTTQTLT